MPKFSHISGRFCCLTFSNFSFGFLTRFLLAPLQLHFEICSPPFSMKQVLLQSPIISSPMNSVLNTPSSRLSNRGCFEQHDLGRYSVTESRHLCTGLSLFFFLGICLSNAVSQPHRVCACSKPCTHCRCLSLKACTVNSEIFARVLFSRNFANTKFREINPREMAKSLFRLLI